jgi:SAM-dependent methyltransferase
MDDALARWLALREPTDAASRSPRLTRLVAQAVADRDPLRVLDLGTGAGSNIRYLANELGNRRQRWLVVDRSEELLRRAATSHLARAASDAAIEIATRRMDLATLEPGLFADRDLVTASALLDLVSDRWLRSLATHARAVGAVMLFTITYNGRTTCSPAEPEDALMLELFNRHQHRDKGLGGPAAGPDAVTRAMRRFSDAGYRVDTEASDWRLEPGDAPLQRELIDGWVFAATETDPAAAATIADWGARRRAHVDAGRSVIVVGHDDLAALL